MKKLNKIALGILLTSGMFAATACFSITLVPTVTEIKAELTKQHYLHNYCDNGFELVIRKTDLESYDDVKSAFVDVADVSLTCDTNSLGVLKLKERLSLPELSFSSSYLDYVQFSSKGYVDGEQKEKLKLGDAMVAYTEKVGLSKFVSTNMPSLLDLGEKVLSKDVLDSKVSK